MSIATLLHGESGSGKSTALRNMDPTTTALIQTVKKPLPFPHKNWTPLVTDDYSTIIKVINAAIGRGKDKVIIDDFQYMMANEFMRRSMEKGFDKFTDIGNHAWQVIKAAGEAPDNLRVYFLSHVATDEFGHTRTKTIGKLLDDKITVEGMFTVVLRSIVDDQGHFFSTQNNGQDTTKSPMGMFAERMIPNDLHAVDKAVCDFYGITPFEPKAQEAK